MPDETLHPEEAQPTTEPDTPSTENSPALENVISSPAEESQASEKTSESQTPFALEPKPIPAPAEPKPGKDAKEKARDEASQSPFSVTVGQVYDGPFDLLLDLIRKQNIDIYDIPISRI